MHIYMHFWTQHAFPHLSERQTSVQAFYQYVDMLKDITEGAFVWDLLCPLNGADLVDSLQVRRQTTVHTQDTLVYNL